MPMGFGPSAGWAQGLTDVVAIDAELPKGCIQILWSRRACRFGGQL